MDAIADGSFQVGVSGTKFAHLFEKCRDAWIEEIRTALRTAWGQYFNQVGEILIIGGSAPLAKPIEEATKGRFKVAPNPQNISIMGMVL
jgi:TRAP-type mannitol/chloroaromatic compound transport system substrate-binding protein